MIRINLRNALLRSFATISTLSLLFISEASAALSVACLSLAILADLHVFYMKRNWAKNFHFGGFMSFLTHPWFPLVLHTSFTILYIFFLVSQYQSEHILKLFSKLGGFFGVISEEYIATEVGLNNHLAAYKIYTLWCLFLFSFSILHARIVFNMNSTRSNSVSPKWAWRPKGRQSLSSDFLGDTTMNFIVLVLAYYMTIRYMLDDSFSVGIFISLALMPVMCLLVVLVVARSEAEIVGGEHDRFDK